MKKKRFSDPSITPMTEVIGTNDVGPASGIGGPTTDAIRPLPMSFDEWTMSSFCSDVDSSGGVDFADYTKWWDSNGFGEDAWLAYNPELAAVEEVVPDLGTDVVDEDILG